jgi:hypothetical protein
MESEPCTAPCGSLLEGCLRRSERDIESGPGRSHWPQCSEMSGFHNPCQNVPKSLPECPEISFTEDGTLVYSTLIVVF